MSTMSKGKIMNTVKVLESPSGKEARKVIDDLVNNALMEHTKTHLMIFSTPHGDWERLLDEAVEAGYYNGKTVTYKTPKGTITFHAKVGAPND